MPHTSVRTIVLALLLSAPAALLAQTPQSTPAPNEADQRLKALYTAEWDWRQNEQAREPEELGPISFADHFPRVDAATQQRRLEYWQKTLADLDKIPLSALSPEEKINAQIFRAVLEEQIVDQRYKAYEAPFNADTFFWTNFTPRQGFQTADDYRRYLGRLRDVPRYFNEQIVNMRAGLARGYAVPRVAVIGRDKTIEPYTKADTTNPLYVPFLGLPTSIPEGERPALRAEAMAAIRDQVVPAYRNLLAMMRN